MHPADLKRRYEELVNALGFAVQDAADGYILLVRGSGPTALPDVLFTTSRAPPRRGPNARPLSVSVTTCVFWATI